MPCANWPTLTQLENALLSTQSEHLQILRHQLDWVPKKPSDVELPPVSVDPTHDRIRIMIDNFGPKCLNSVDSEGNTLVHQAAFEAPDEKALKLIVKTVGKDDQSHFYRQGKDGYTVIESAALNPCNGALKYLVKMLGTKGVKQTNESEFGVVHISALYQGADSMEFFKDMFGASCFHKLYSCNQRNVFHFAAMNTNSNEALAWLIKDIGTAPLKIRDKLGNTPVHLAAWMQGDESMQMIYDQIGSEMFNLKGQDDESIVHSAAQNEVTNTALLWCIKMLSTYGLMTQDSLGRMAIHHVATYQDETALKLAVEAMGKDCLLAKGEKEMTVVHYAAMNTNTLSTLRWIVEQLGSDCLIKQRDSEAQMPIHIAAWYQGLESLKFTVQSVGLTAFDLVSGRGRTIAHYAALNDKKEELMNWISARAAHALNLPDIIGETPASLAGI